jgi:hypothetical protein
MALQGSGQITLRAAYAHMLPEEALGWLKAAHSELHWV